MKIQVLGSGCHDCLKLELLVGDIVRELRRGDATVARVSEEREIRRYMPVEREPGLVIDGRLVSSGEVPPRRLLRRWLSAA